MAFQAAVGDVEDALLGVLVFGLTLVVTLVTVHVFVVVRVTGRAGAACVPMVHREVVPLYVDVIPSRRAVAFRALPFPVTGGRGMARLAVRGALVVEIGRQPA